MKRFSVELEGKVPLLMHRYPGEQPSAQKAPIGKKTQEHINAAHLKDWTQSAYYSEGRGFYIPPENIETMLANGAKKFRMKPDFRAAITVEEDFIPFLIPDSAQKYSPATKPLQTYHVPEHIDIRGVRLPRGARIDRCRPIFRRWALAFTLAAEDTISLKQITDALAGNWLGDFWPRFGRFAVKRIAEL
jgi:hypothetical protein